MHLSVACPLNFIPFGLCYLRIFYSISAEFPRAISETSFLKSSYISFGLSRGLVNHSVKFGNCVSN